MFSDMSPCSNFLLPLAFSPLPRLMSIFSRATNFISLSLIYVFCDLIVASMISIWHLVMVMLRSAGLGLGFAMQVHEPVEELR